MLGVEGGVGESGMYSGVGACARVSTTSRTISVVINDKINFNYKIESYLSFKLIESFFYIMESKYITM